MSQATVIWTLKHLIQGSGRQDYCYSGNKHEAVLTTSPIRSTLLLLFRLPYIVMLQRNRELMPSNVFNYECLSCSDVCYEGVTPNVLL